VKLGVAELNASVAASLRVFAFARGFDRAEAFDLAEAFFFAFFAGAFFAGFLEAISFLQAGEATIPREASQSTRREVTSRSECGDPVAACEA